jgi:hypothetical protein
MSKILSSSKSKNTVQPSLDSKIYKVKQLVNGEITTIYVFNGKLVTDNEEELFKKIFTDEELEIINAQKINIVFSEEKIHFDDSIGTIKIKILKQLERDLSLDELYLFCQKEETLNAVAVYQALTQKNKLSLTKIRLDQFISNIVSDENGDAIKPPADKDVYTFDDIFEMKFDNKKYIVNKVLGQKFFIVENEYPFVCNPYSVTDYDRLLEKTARKSLTTLNSHLLLNSGDIVDNSIYLCLAEDVIPYVGRKDLSEETTIKIYYPFLYNKNINSIEDLDKNRDKLMQNNSKILNKKTFNAFKTIDMFYDVYNLRKSELNYVNRGIKYIKAVLVPEFYIKIPLELIFKVVHATQENPLIKFNPSSRQENVYRLFADKNSTDGRKIPYLKKAAIFKLKKTIARNKSVAVYIETKNAGTNQSLICEFDEEGFITLSAEFGTIVSINDIDELFRNSINPVITEIKHFLEQSGYKLNTFNSLNDENVEIKQLTYETQISIKKPLDIEAYKGCLSSIFINETNVFKGNTINLRFKRVANYSNFTSQEAFILEKSEQGLRGDQIIEALLENFTDELNRKEAEEMVRKIANELEIERGVRKSDIKIKNSPGFKTIISLEKETGIITIVTENINNINYLHTLPIYLDTMVRLTQDKNATNYPVKEITRLCSKEKYDVHIDDIISITEEAAPKSHIPSIEKITEDEEDVKYNTFKNVEMNKPKGALSLFFDHDDEEEEPEYGGGQDLEIVGGVSESSISSDDEYNDNEEIDAEDIKSTIPSDISSLQKSESSIESVPASLTPDKSSSKQDEEEYEEDIVKHTQEPVVSEESIISENSIKPEINREETNDIPSEETISSEEIVPEPRENKAEAEVELEEKPLTGLEKADASLEEDSDASLEEEESDENLEEDIRNIDGMKLNKPYYFQSLIEKKDPVLILKEDTPQFNSYPRTCSSNMRRQPVILTDTQLDKINKEHPGFLREEDVVKYGSNPKNQFNYICPRFWCLKNNTFVDPNDLKEVIGKDGKKELVHPTCGKVLPKNEKIVKPGYYIYEFYTPKPGKKDYKKYPSLIPDSHPDGYCLPCCFDKYNTEGRIKAMQKCKATTIGEKTHTKEKEEKEENEEIEETKEKEDIDLDADIEKVGLKGKRTKKRIEDKEEDEYIKGPDKFPLEPGRWGYLPVEIQTILREVNADCQISKTNTNIKENHPCLLRHGVEVNVKQSFVACISDAIFFGKRVIDENNKLTNKSAPILSIREMCDRIIKAISIDTFIKYQNGNLVIDFSEPNRKINVNKYKNTKLFSKINMNKEEDKIYFLKVISAYENFVDFLSDSNALIDHTYLWDIISMPNKYLFPNGVNLIIFQIPKDDITNNVELLCPTNHYSTQFYEARKPTIILMKEDGYYEPIYSYSSNNKKISVTKEFKEYDNQLSKTMRAVFKEIIRPFFDTICRPLDSMPNVYKAKRPLLLYDLVQKLDKYEYKILKMVVNFNNKVIGVVAQEPEPSTRTGFIPCYPSAIDESIKKDLNFVFMTDTTLWNTYTETVQFLNKLDRRSKKRRVEPDIPCKPAFKIVEEEHVVGILTNTNQFIQLSQPIRLDEVNPDLDMPSIDNDNYIVNVKANPMVSTDVEIMVKQDIDKERVDYIKRIRLETSFYNVFRNTIRILINDYENATLREKIEQEMLKEYIIYSEKLKNIDSLLRDLVKDKIQFIGDNNYYKLINEVSSCIVKDNASCSATPNLCVVTENGKCNLILPEKNLITNKVNEPIYYGRMADELIRYNRIKSFMLHPQTYLSFGNIGYNLRDNEIILIDSLLTQEYFETLVPSVTNKYIKHNSYDEVEPIITQVYDNTVEPMNNENKLPEKSCDKIEKTHITSSIWKACFPSNFKEIEYGKYISCTFDIIIDLIEKQTGNKLTINQIKNELFIEYKQYLMNYGDKIVDILILEGKKTLGEQVRNELLSFANFLYAENYFLTPLDLWLLVTKYKIPTIFICQRWILQTKYEKHEFVAYGNKDDKFAFILVPGFSPEKIPSYKLIQSTDGNSFISIDRLNGECLDRIYSTFNEPISIEKYLKHFTKPKKTNYEKKKPQILIIESD